MRIQQMQQELEGRQAWIVYAQRARLLAHIMIPNWFPQYDPQAHHLDHRYSIACGYQQGLPLEVISSRGNLELLTPRENMSKGRRCSIDLATLMEAYRPEPLVTRAAALVNGMNAQAIRRAFRHVSRRLRRGRETREIARRWREVFPE